MAGFRDHALTLCAAQTLAAAAANEKVQDGGDINHAMRVYKGLSRGAGVAGYFARVGILTASDCRDAGSAVVKMEQEGGVINIENSIPLV